MKIIILLFYLFSIITFSQTYVPDNSFGNNGMVTINFNANEFDNTSSYSFGLDDSQNIYVLGRSSNFDSLYILKYSNSGVLDNDFGVNGLLSLSFLGEEYRISNLNIYNGNIILSALTGSYPNILKHKIKLLANGELDTSFGNGGYLQENGSIKFVDNYMYVFKNITVNNINYLRIKRINYSDGSVDLSYGNNGIVDVFINDLSENIKEINYYNNTFFIKSSTNDYTLNEFNNYIINITINGELNTNFGENGILQLSSFTNSQSKSVYTINSTGDLFVANQIENSFTTSKYNLNGELDTNYGENGVLDNDINFNNYFYLASISPVENGFVVQGDLSGFEESYLGLVPFNLESLDPNYLLNNYSYISYYLNYQHNSVLINDTNILILGETFWYSSNQSIVLNKYTKNILNTEDATLSNLKIYPNPSSDFIFIENNNLINSNYQILDNLGRQILKGKISNSKKITISNFENGLYFLNIENKTFKIIKK